MNPENDTLTVGQCVQLACIFEATARKAGNVHRYRDFADLTYADFLLSAAVVGPVLESTRAIGVGRTVLSAIRRTQSLVPTNCNLGIVLLLAPLASASADPDLRAGVKSVLQGLTIDDSAAAFEAIRLAKPGGLGEAPSQDVYSEPTMPLRDIMALAQDRDLVARQYATDFHDIFELGVPALLEEFDESGELETAIIAAHLRLIAKLGDTHVQRRAGIGEAKSVQQRAAVIVDADWPRNKIAREGFVAFDRWLREPGTKRNPGATADLIAACLFVALGERRISLPVRFNSSAEPLP